MFMLNMSVMVIYDDGYDNVMIMMMMMMMSPDDDDDDDDGDTSSILVWNC